MDLSVRMACNQLSVTPTFDDKDEDDKQKIKKDLEPQDGEYVRLVKLTSSMFSSLLLAETSLKESESEQSNQKNNGLVTANETDDQLVYDGEQRLVSGSLDALIRHLVPTPDYYPDRPYLFAFLLCSRLFIRPYELLQRVHHLTVMARPSQDHYTPDHLSQICPKMVQLLSDWAETFPYDFRDDHMMRHLKTVTQRCTQLDNRLRKEVTMLMQNLLHKLNKLDKYEDVLDGHSGVPLNAVISPPPATDVTEVCSNPVALAHQLTHIELEKLGHIGPEEFVQAFAVENPVVVETDHCILKSTKNLESYVQWFNRTSNLVATEICRHPKKKTRVKLIEYFIEAARECFNEGNFNSMMAIVAGLNLSPVSRLKKTWGKVNTAKFDILEHQMDPTSNFASYRSTLKAAMWRSQGAVDGSEKIIVPCFSLLLKDLYFLNEGCANKLPNGHINFEKFWQLSKQVSEFISWQTVTCPFEKLPKVIHYLTTTSIFSESALAMASFDCESPDNHVEKERYKSLKCELLLVH